MLSQITQFRARLTALALGIVGLTNAPAQTWTEIGDAGELLANYQNAYGTGALTAINGSITSNNADLFGIIISNPAIFSATTSGALSDPQLFLFRLDGTGILGNDDAGGGLGLQAQLPAGDSRLTVLSAGQYLLAISGYDRDPLDFSGNPLFEDHYPGLDLALTAGPLSQWGGSSSTGAYTITLTGAGFVAIPEPAATVAIAAGACALAIGLFRYGGDRRFSSLPDGDAQGP